MSWSAFRTFTDPDVLKRKLTAWATRSATLGIPSGRVPSLCPPVAPAAESSCQRQPIPQFIKSLSGSCLILS